jgi:hypothetical protein
MIILANRPGFPFLGNDFFGALGNRTGSRQFRFKIFEVKDSVFTGFQVLAQLVNSL